MQTIYFLFTMTEWRLLIKSRVFPLQDTLTIAVGLCRISSSARALLQNFLGMERLSKSNQALSKPKKCSRERIFWQERSECDLPAFTFPRDIRSQEKFFPKHLSLSFHLLSYFRKQSIGMIGLNTEIFSCGRQILKILIFSLFGFCTFAI